MWISEYISYFFVFLHDFILPGSYSSCFSKVVTHLSHVLSHHCLIFAGIADLNVTWYQSIVFKVIKKIIDIETLLTMKEDKFSSK